MARALGLTAADLVLDDLAAAQWSAGNAFTCVPVRNLDVMARCRVDLAAFDEVFGGSGPGAAFLFCRETREPSSAFHEGTGHATAGGIDLDEHSWRT